MRDISTDYLNELTNVRRIGAKMTFRDTRLVFEPFSSGESNLPEMDNPNQWDAEPFGLIGYGEFHGQWAGVLRVARTSDGYLAYQAIYDHASDPPWPDWTITTHQLLPCKPGIARIGTSQGMYIYAAMELGAEVPHIVYFYWSPGGLSGPYQVAQLQRNNFLIGALPSSWEYPDNTGIAFAGLRHDANGPFRFALQYFPYDTVRDTNYAVIQYVETTNQTTWAVSEFPGAIYGDMDDPYRFDAEMIGDRVFFFTTDNELGRPLMVVARPKWIGSYLIPEWSDTRYVFPLDVLDDDSFLNLGHASQINNELWLTGRLKRGENIEMDIYMRGNDQGNFSLGRDMYIANSEELPVSDAGKMIVMNNKIFYIGHGKYAVADATSLTGVDHLDKKVSTRDINNFSLNTRASNSWTLNTLLRSDFDHDAVRKSAQVVLDVGLQDDTDLWHWEQMGVFGIDAITSDYFGSGNERQLLMRGLGSKRLSQWTSDAFYDYWSQAKLVTDPAELSEVIRASGQWETDEDMDEEPIRLDELNEIGILYTAAKASRNGQCSARFYYPNEQAWEQQIHSGRFGVGINYYRESRASAAERLGVESGEVTDSQFGDNGLFAVYEPSRTEIVLYAVYGSVWHELTSDSFTVTDNSWIWMEIKFNDGRVIVSTSTSQGDDALDWYAQIDYKMDTNVTSTVNIEPWFRDQRGRGAVVIENVSVHSETPGFHSTADIIPVEDMAPFPNAGRVIVDSEIIDYDGKKDVPAALSNLTITWSEDGVTWPSAPHNNDLWDGVQIYGYPWLATANDNQRFARSINECQMIIQALPKPYGRERIDKVRLPIARIRNPTLPVYVWIANDDLDNAFYPEWGIGRAGQPIIPMVSAPVYPSAIPGTPDPDNQETVYSWVEFDMTVTPESLRWLNPFYTRGYFLCVGVIPPIYIDETQGYRYGTDFNAYQDSDNYYRVRIDHQVGVTAGTWRTWARGTSWDSSQERTGHPESVMPYDIYGTGNIPKEGYEIYVEGPLPENHRQALDGASLVVTSGPGAGSSYRITDYDWRAPDQWVPTKTYIPPETYEEHIGNEEHGYWETPDLARFFVARNPYNAFGDGTQFQCYDALQVEERGVEETAATAHGPGHVSIYTPLSVSIDEVRYFSGEMDMRLEDMAREICAKSGVLNFTAGKDYDGDFTPWDYTSGDKNIEWMPGERRNGIVKMYGIDTGFWGEYGIIFRSNTDNPDSLSSQYYVLALKNYASFLDLQLRVKIANETEETIVERYPLFYDEPRGEWTFSFQGGVFSAWLEGRHVHTFADDTLASGEYCGFFVAGDSDALTVDWSEVDIRVDNFVLDLGYRGAQLMSSLIGPKKVVWMDAQDGGIYMERLRTSGDPEYTLTDLTVEAARADADNELINRVRAEGAEIAEVVDWESLREDGNIFLLVNATEANDLWETAKEAQFIIDDSKTRVERHIVLGAADPRVEPNDIIKARSTESFKDLIVDSVTFSMRSSADEVEFDMTIEGLNAS